jgi:hypothetical protein
MNRSLVSLDDGEKLEKQPPNPGRTCPPVSLVLDLCFILAVHAKYSKPALPRNQRTLQRPHPSRTAALVLLRTPPRIACWHRPATGRPASPARRLPVRVRASESEQPTALTLALQIERACTTARAMFLSPKPRAHRSVPRPSFFPSSVFLSSYPRSPHRLRCTKTARAQRGYGQDPLQDEGARMRGRSRIRRDPL